MVGFAALSNTLLLTSKTFHNRVVSSLKKIIVLISILSNTFARIDAVRPTFCRSNVELPYILERQSRGSIVSIVDVLSS
jgi:hypothetical protein